MITRHIVRFTSRFSAGALCAAMAFFFFCVGAGVFGLFASFYLIPRAIEEEEPRIMREMIAKFGQAHIPKYDCRELANGDMLCQWDNNAGRRQAFIIKGNS